MHSFSGDAAWAEKFLDLDFDLSYSGVVSFTKATEVHEAAKVTPLERMMVETDAPYLTPVPYRGSKTSPPSPTLWSKRWPNSCNAP
ncbi:TatD family hydrolase [Limosilactobacillus fermentum]|nr:TatD family hydrolase [Limosilactobacillus fermentum]